MGNLTIKDKTKQDLLKHCTPELLSKVFSCVGLDNMVIDSQNLCDNIWDITDIVKLEDKIVLDNLKVIYVFNKLGGTLIYENKEVAYQVLFRLLNRNEPNNVMFYWIHTDSNDMIPIYDIGELVVPEIMPRYVCKKISDQAFQIEKLVKGEYVGINDFYPTEELCKQRVKELIEEYKADE